MSYQAELCMRMIVQRCNKPVGKCAFHCSLIAPLPRLKRASLDAISSLEAVQTFLDSRGYSEDATRIAS